MRFNTNILLLALPFFAVSASFATDCEKQFRQFVNDELKPYPEAHLTDFY